MLSKALPISSENLRIHQIHSEDLQCLAESDIKSFLDDEEMFLWRNYAQKTHRQQEWLRGRIVLKEVIQQQLLKSYFNIELNQIHIRQTDLCQPYFYTEQDQQITFPISLSHGSGTSVACGAPHDTKVGIDYENISERNAGPWLERAFHDRELELFSDRDFVTLLGYWTAKEAASKAHGTGLRDGWREWRVCGILKDAELDIRHQNHNFKVKLHRLGDELISVCRIG